MSDLINREDVENTIQRLCDLCGEYERYNGVMCGACNLDNFIRVLDDIPSAEPERKTFHVIDKTTGKEADPYEIALKEDWAKSLCYCDMEGFAILEDGTLILTDECGRFEFIQENDRFEIVWDKVTDED